MAPFGTLSGTLRSPSMSSLNASSRDGLPVSAVNACRTQLVRATSPKVPICGRPEGPYPVSNSASALPDRSSRAATLAASSNGHAFGSGELLRTVSDIGRTLGIATGGVNRPPPPAG